MDVEFNNLPFYIGNELNSSNIYFAETKEDKNKLMGLQPYI